MATAAELRALADRVEQIEGLETAVRLAREAYRLAPDDPARKAAHRTASQTLADARRDMRSSGVLVADASAGSTTVRIGSVGAEGKA